MEKLYHVSCTEGLKWLTPHVSTHGRAYVYATKNPDFALLFGSEKYMGDFDGAYGIYEDGTPYFYEAYKGALKRAYKGEKCFVYEVDPTNFETGKTSFSGEVVSEKPAKIIGYTVVEDVYEKLLELERQGKFKIVRFSKETEDMMQKHIADRIIRWHILDGATSYQYKFCKEHFASLIEQLEKQYKKNEHPKQKLETIFYVSNIKGLKTFERPNYHFCGRDPILGLLWGGKKFMTDLDGIIMEENTICFYESYKNALKYAYDGERCFVYKVIKSAKTEKITCEEIDDIYEKLLELEKQGKFKIVRFSKETKDMVQEHVKSKIIKCHILDDKETKVYKYCKKHFPSLVKKLEKEKPSLK